MMEDIALNYFRSLSKEQRKSMVERIFAQLSEEEKLEMAKILLKKTKK